MTLPGIFLVDRAGRRPLLIAGAIGMGVSKRTSLLSRLRLSPRSSLGQFIVAIVGTVIGQGNPAGQQVLIAFVCIFIAFFASTWDKSASLRSRDLY